MITDPSFRSSICGATIWISQWLDTTLFCRILPNWSSLIPAIGPA